MRPTVGGGASESMRRKRVLFTLTDLHAGGAQRVVLTLLRHLPRDEFELAVALVRREGAFLGEIPQDVPVHDLGAKRVRQAGPAIVRLARRERPDVLFSTLSYLNNYVLLLRPFLPRTTRIVVREAIAVSSAVRTWRMPWLWPLLFRLLYRRADAILCQCRFMGDDLVRSFGVPREKIRTIYNPVDAERVRASSRSGDDPFAGFGAGPHVVAAGRIAPQKGFDLLVDAVPALLARFPNAHLWILGEDTSTNGNVLDDLRERCRQQGTGAQVHFEGLQSNPYRYFGRADLFVLSSRYEGLPNVLLEALACGCPALALDRPGGTREIMEMTGQRDRLLADLVWEPRLFRQQGAPPIEPDLSRFGVERVVQEYADVFRRLGAGTGPAANEEHR